VTREMPFGRALSEDHSHKMLEAPGSAELHWTWANGIHGLADPGIDVLSGSFAGVNCSINLKTSQQAHVGKRERRPLKEMAGPDAQGFQPREKLQALREFEEGQRQ